jgi:alpha/beta superfamily hydrolase
VAKLDLIGPAGPLEALLEGDPGARFAAVVCHPHPRFGGTLENNATHRLAKAARSAGGLSLRFNFRGVGRSAGVYDEGRGEADDVRAALAYLKSNRAGLPLLACGFSFGAWMALAGGADPDVRGILLAGLPLHSADVDGVHDAVGLRALEKPIAVIQAEQDRFGAPKEVEQVLAGSRGPRRLVAIPGASHLFREDLPGLLREAEAAFAWLLAPGGG